MGVTVPWRLPAEAAEGIQWRERMKALQTSPKPTFPPWLVWLSGLSAGLQTKGLPVRFPVRAHAWVVGQVPGIGGGVDV